MRLARSSNWQLTLRQHPLAWALLAAFLLLYLPLGFRWIHGWVYKSISIEHEYFSYGLIGFPFAGYLAWGKRAAWQRLPASHEVWPLAILALAMVFYLSRISDLVSLSLPLVLVGLCGVWKGRAGIKLMAAPLAFAALATPNEIPYLISPHTLPLQQVIASSAGFLLSQIGLNVTVEGIYLYVNNRIVEVAPHCAGLKMLLTSWYVGLMLLYWTGAIRSPKRIVALYLGTTVISVVMNAFRNTLLSYFHGTGQEGMFELFHEGLGGDIYSALMLGAIVLWMDAINRLATPQGENA